MNQINADKEAGVKGSVEPGVGNTLHASQLQILIRLYERIQAYIYRLMATDSVPKVSSVVNFWDGLADPRPLHTAVLQDRAISPVDEEHVRLQ